MHPEYFIGSIVVCPASEGVLELIDGQQRMTTLFLALCAIRDGLEELGEKPPGALQPQIAATSTDAYGRRHVDAERGGRPSIRLGRYPGGVPQTSFVCTRERRARTLSGTDLKKRTETGQRIQPQEVPRSKPATGRVA